ncbi:MAG: WD40 repeat domain-containing protein, partial [Candidatus Saccharimonadales bacterium]
MKHAIPRRLQKVLATTVAMLAASPCASAQHAPDARPGVFAGHKEALSGAKFSPNGKLLVTGSFDHSLKIWDAATARELRTLAGHQHQVLALDVSLDDTLLASGSRDNT